MAFDFPNNPTDGQTVLHTENNKYYKWDATAGIWNVDVGKRIQDFIDSLVDAAPGTLDTLNELAAAINDDPAFITTMTTANTTLQTNIDNLATVASAARVAIQADVDANEASSLAARNAIQADVDQNESDSDAAIAAELAARVAAITALQADVDQNESDADAAIAVETARIDAILNLSTADKDSFAEIVTLINSVDTENDTAFGGYVTSNNAAVASNLALLVAQRALEWDAVFATHGSLYATTTTVG